MRLLGRSREPHGGRRAMIVGPRQRRAAFGEAIRVASTTLGVYGGSGDIQALIGSGRFDERRAAVLAALDACTSK
jgi:hypothetical protein